MTNKRTLFFIKVCFIVSIVGYTVHTLMPTSKTTTSRRHRNQKKSSAPDQLLKEHSRPSVVIWELHGVLFHTSNSKALAQLGMRFGLYVATHGFDSAERLKKKLFDIMHTISPAACSAKYARHFLVCTVGDTDPLPHLMYAWLKGIISSSETLKKINDAIDACNNTIINSAKERTHLKNLAGLIFDPARLHAIRVIDHHMSTLLKKCAQKKYKQYIYANIDGASFDLLCTNKPFRDDIFFYIPRDHAVISGKEHCIITEPAMFEKLLERLKKDDISPQTHTCYFINDKDKVATMAQQRGFIPLKPDKATAAILK
mgnify:CR=1 FL=1